MIAALRERVPEYQRPLRGRFGVGIRRGVEEALGQFADLIADPSLDRSASERVYRGLGRGEHRERRPLDVLLAAYRVGARVSWRRVSAIAIEEGVDRETLALLAEAVFAYIDELSALSVEGYAREQSIAAGEVERRRRPLALLILDSEPDDGAIAAAAAEAGWEPPETVAALAWAGGDGRRFRARLPAGLLTAEADAASGLALLPDPQGPGVRGRIARAAGDLLVVLGPAVAPTEARASAERARAVRGLALAGSIQATGVVLADDHLGALVAHGDEAALAALATRRLAPLADETPASRARLSETLRAWLDHQGEVAAVAAQLHVHPQTVRYRLARLRERFGDVLDDPDGRFELALALRSPAERLLA